MRNDLSSFEFDLLRKLIFGCGTPIHPVMLKNLLSKGYAENVFSQTRASDLGRARFLIGLSLYDRQKPAYEARWVEYR